MLVSSDFHAVCNEVTAGGVIAYPTEAVFGLGCDPRKPEAIQKLLDIKQRSPDKGLILVAANFEQLRPFLAPHISPTEEQQAAAPITWIFPAHADTSTLLTGAHTTLAIRVSQHPLVQALCNELGHPLTSTSANISGQPPCRLTQQVIEQFTDHTPNLNAILDGATGSQRNPTEIRDAVSGKVLRHS